MPAYVGEVRKALREENPAAAKVLVPWVRTVFTAGEIAGS